MTHRCKRRTVPGRCWLAALTVAAAIGSAAPAVAQATGSGTVLFEFTTFYGPFGIVEGNDASDPSTWFYSSRINGESSTTASFGALTTAESGFSSGSVYGVGGRGLIGTGGAASGYGPSSVSFEQEIGGMAMGNGNLLSFAPDAFSNVTTGQPFRLGTLSFTNGAWYGSGATSDLNTPSLFGFRVSTLSADGATWNQTAYGIVRHVVNSPANNDLTTPGGMDAEADWLTVYSFNTSSAWGSTFNCFVNGGCDDLTGLGSFRVYDPAALPPGYTNTGSIDIIAAFNSLDLIDLANPVGGFLTDGNQPLPPVTPGAVPEPAGWASMILGFGLVGAWARRRRYLPASA